jgi:hypothetical protein
VVADTLGARVSPWAFCSVWDVRGEAAHRVSLCVALNKSLSLCTCFTTHELKIGRKLNSGLDSVRILVKP